MANGFMRAVLEQLQNGNLIVDVSQLLEAAPEATVNFFQDFDANISRLESILAQQLGRSRPRLRFRHIPSFLLHAVHHMKELRHDLVGCFLTFSGLVASMSSVKVAEFTRSFECSCGARKVVEAPVAEVRPPEAGCCGGCGGDSFKDLGGAMIDYQEIRLQDTGLQNCSHAQVVLCGELVSSCVPGDLVVVCGVLRARWPNWAPKKRLMVQLILDARDLHQLHEAPRRSLVAMPPAADPWQQRRQMVTSVAAHLHGLEVPKLAVLLVLLADDLTAPRQEESSRQHSHLLLLGDPGTGKSQLLQAAGQLAPHCVMTSASGTTRSGLTFSCVRDGAGWNLEVGALSMADGGVCCIDEFRHLPKEEKTALYEAMEQQSISVAKSGVACQLRARCSIIAAQSFVPNGQSLKELSGLADPLLSRFDLALALRSQGGNDEDVIASILNQCANSTNDFGCQSPGQVELDQLKGFIVAAKQSTLAESAYDASLLLEAYYRKLRRGSLGAVFSPRVLESLIRLSRAHARLMQHGSVQLEDAIAVIFLHQVAWKSHSPETEQVLLSHFGPGCPEQIQRLDMSSDITCRKDYEVVEGAVLWCLGFQDLKSEEPKDTGGRLKGGGDRGHSEEKPSSIFEGRAFVPQIRRKGKIKERSLFSPPERCATDQGSWSDGGDDHFLPQDDHPWVECDEDEHPWTRAQMHKLLFAAR
ncbi:unnamed protein product [Durusdinium trenchii]|uniref:MCM C-terminal AAA(+) ATPase domain-containing protein n=1 Tax=Durusdinium trenchii TaxID=1381693 RepID=A0ABP0SWI8_9DINO